MKRIKLFLIICISFISGILLTNYIYNKYNTSEVINSTLSSNNSSSIAMMIETSAGSDEYYLSTDTSWPDSTIYEFNESISKCENGSTLTYDSENNQILMSGTKSDRCYVYFDYISTIEELCNGLTLSDCIINVIYESDGVNNLYYHDSGSIYSGTYTNSDLEASDLSYRYSGSSEYVANYVCFGSDDCSDTDNLYRIIGAFKNEEGEYEVKLVKYDYATSSLLGEDGEYNDTENNSLSYYLGKNTGNIASYYWNVKNASTSYSNSGYYNDWSYSELNKTNLNINFLTKIGDTWSNLIANHTWIVGGNTHGNIFLVTANNLYLNEILSPLTTTGIADTVDAKVGLMYVNDYAFAADPTYWSEVTNNYKEVSCEYDWVYMGVKEWVITRSYSSTNYVFTIGNDGNVYLYYINDTNAVRPCFYLSSSVEYSSGTGTQSDPIILVTE